MATGHQQNWNCSSITQEMLENETLTVIPLFENYLALFVAEPSDKKDYNLKEYLLNLTDGSITPETLRCLYNGHDLQILGFYQDSLCVIVDYKDVTFQFEDEEGMHEYESVTPVYAMIDKKDFIASNPNYRIIPAPTIPTGASG